MLNGDECFDENGNPYPYGRCDHCGMPDGPNHQCDCPHLSTYFAPEHDNFYCSTCHRGMGIEYYQKHILTVPKGGKPQRLDDTVIPDHYVQTFTVH